MQALIALLVLPLMLLNFLGGIVGAIWLMAKNWVKSAFDLSSASHCLT